MAEKSGIQNSENVYPEKDMHFPYNEGTARKISEESLASFIIDMPEYMISHGFEIDQNFPVYFFSVFHDFLGNDKLNINSFKALENYISPLIVKNSSDYFRFHETYCKYIEEHGKKLELPKEKERTFTIMSNKYRNYVQRKSELDKQEEKLRKNISEESSKKRPALVKKKELNKYKEMYKEVKNDYRKILEKDKNYESLLNIEKTISGEKRNIETMSSIAEMERTLKKSIPEAFKYKKSIQLLQFIQLQKKMLDVIKKYIDRSYDSNEAKLNRLLQERTQINNEIFRLRENFKKETLSVIEKGESHFHRDEFINRNNRAVKSSKEGEIMLTKNFSSLSPAEKEKIKGYIHENARKFRTKLSRKIRSAKRHEIDMGETCKHACSTYGIPMKLNFIKPKRNKTKLVMFLDVSGSCRSASELMLYFMSQMKEIFHGGCRTYVFTNKIYDVSNIFDNAVDGDEASRKILDMVPRAGSYSDYNKPFKQFYEDDFRYLTKDSIVFFIGDARNNKNKSGEEYIKAIARRSRKAYWLNTDDINKWDQGDSIFSVYSKYMSEYGECKTVSQLLNFLTEVK